MSIDSNVVNTILLITIKINHHHMINLLLVLLVFQHSNQIGKLCTTTSTVHVVSSYLTCQYTQAQDNKNTIESSNKSQVKVPKYR